MRKREGEQERKQCFHYYKHNTIMGQFFFHLDFFLHLLVVVFVHRLAYIYTGHPSYILCVVLCACATKIGRLKRLSFVGPYNAACGGWWQRGDVYHKFHGSWRERKEQKGNKNNINKKLMAGNNAIITNCFLLCFYFVK